MKRAHTGVELGSPREQTAARGSRGEHRTEGSMSAAAPAASHSTPCSCAISDRHASLSSAAGASMARHLAGVLRVAVRKRTARALHPWLRFPSCDPGWGQASG